MEKHGIYPKLNEIEIVENMPNWNPGSVNGENVNVRYTFPLVFRLK